MASKECDRILDGLVVDDQGELVLDESFRHHLEECPRCREVYDSIQRAKAEEVPNYVPAVMQRISEECSEILEGLVVDAKGELVLDEGFRKHLDGCSRCREIYDRIEASKAEEVPDYVPAVMRRISKMEASPSSARWLERLKDFLDISLALRPRVLIPSAAAIAIMLVLCFCLYVFPGRNQSDEYVNIVNIDRAESLAEFADMDERISIALDRYVDGQVELFQEDL